jgi:hypothetical protein
VDRVSDATDDMGAAGTAVDGEPAARDVEPATPHPAVSLRLVRVEYHDGPDRWTVHPRNADRVTLVATWLTADREAFVDLGDVR